MDGDLQHIVKMESDVYGTEEFPYDSFGEAMEGLQRLTISAIQHQREDGVQRKVYYAGVRDLATAGETVEASEDEETEDTVSEIFSEEEDDLRPPTDAEMNLPV